MNWIPSDEKIVEVLGVHPTTGSAVQYKEIIRWGYRELFGMLDEVCRDHRVGSSQYITFEMYARCGKANLLYFENDSWYYMHRYLCPLCIKDFKEVIFGHKRTLTVK